MTIKIKNMVCDRCILVVRQQLGNLGLKNAIVSMGGAQFSSDLSADRLLEVSSALNLLGFEVIDNEKEVLIENIRRILINKIQHGDLSEESVSFPTILTRELNKEYAYLSRLFSSTEEVTIEKFIIQQKIEKVKELLEYGELNLNEIAFKMGYSSSAHLSAQFKGVTGYPPSQFKLVRPNERKSLDKI